MQKAAQGQCPARCVYIAPMASLAKERLADWSLKFGAALKLNVVELCGEATVSWLDSEKALSTQDARDIAAAAVAWPFNVTGIRICGCDGCCLAGQGGAV